jgi:YHS domain-containing protein
MSSLMSFSYFPSREVVHGAMRAHDELYLATDPVCGRELAPHDAAVCVIYRGVTYYFCSDSCHHSFTRQAGRYADVCDD